MNILFLGNSLIYYNDLPGIFFGLAQAAGKDVPLVSSVTKGSATMSDFADAGSEVGKKMRKLLRERTWDYVVIEPSRRITPCDDSVLRAETEAARILQTMAGAAGAQILLYAVWGNDTGELKVFRAETPTQICADGTHPIARGAHTQFMHEMAHRIGGVLGGVPVVEAGYAFENLLAARADIDLYHTDRRHPSPAGSYLAACAFYAKIFGERTVGINDPLCLPDRALLQQIADATVIDGRTPDLPRTDLGPSPTQSTPSSEDRI